MEWPGSEFKTKVRESSPGVVRAVHGSWFGRSLLPQPLFWAWQTIGSLFLICFLRDKSFDDF